MKQIFRDRKGNVVLEELPAPAVTKGRALVRVHHSLISSGTETRSLLSTQKDFSKKASDPSVLMKLLKKAGSDGIPAVYRRLKSKLETLAPLGYSCAGEVVEKADDINDINIGDIVACLGAEYAYHAELVSVPRNMLVKVPKTVSTKEAAFVTIASIALHAVRNARAQLGDRVAVVGLGLIGQIVVQLLRLSGAKVIGIDILPERVALAKKLGAEQGVAIHEKADFREVLAATDHLGVDAAIICAPNATFGILEKAAAICRDKGRFVVVGTLALTLPYEIFYRKELELIVSRSTGPGRYDELFESRNQDYPIGYVRWTERRNAEEFISLMASRKLDVNSLISAVYDLREAKKAYSQLLRGGSLGIVLEYAHEGRPEHLARTVKLHETPITKERLSVAVAGLGTFANNVQLPEIARNKDFFLHSVASNSSTRAFEMAKKFSAGSCTTDYKEVLKNPGIDLVVITTRNKFHAEMAIQAAEAKKGIFLEKPMAMSLDEMKNIVRAVKKNNVFFTLGLNRRFSPLSAIAKEVASSRQGPIMIHYRFNDDRKADRAWVEDLEQGGGRVLHLCNHMIDFCSWLTNAEPLDVFSKSVQSKGAASVIDQDNILMTTNFSDGSLATMMYTSLGNDALERERIEIFFDNKAIIITNFQSIAFFGVDRKNITLPEPDKGYRRQLAEIAKRMKGDVSAEFVTLSDAVRSQVFCLKAIESLTSGKTLALDYTSYL